MAARRKVRKSISESDRALFTQVATTLELVAMAIDETLDAKPETIDTGIQIISEPPPVKPPQKNPIFALNHSKLTDRKWYGYIPDAYDSRDHVMLVQIPATLPDSVNLRQFMPPVYDQGQIGSCTANAIAAAIQFDRNKQALNGWQPSRLFIYANERIMENVPLAEDSGAQIRDGIKSVATVGVCPETEWPYDIAQFATKPPDACYTHAVQHLALKYQRVPQTKAALMAVLASGYPFVFGFTVYDGFESEEVAKSGVLNLPAPNEKVVGGHAVLCVGYDKPSDRLIVRNSWGDWGQGGNFTIPFDYVCNNEMADDFWCINVVG